MPGSEKVCANLTALIEAELKAAEIAMSRYGMQACDWAKRNHPWRNRTGWAEASLGHYTFRDPARIETFVYHGVTYGVFLELREDFEGRYQVLDKAIMYNISGLMSQLRNIFGGKGFGLTISEAKEFENIGAIYE